MLRDTLASQEQLPGACARFRKSLPRRAPPTLAQRETTIRQGLNVQEAYCMVPGRDPQSS